jgi:predicted RNA-binding Zn ribbon-like protein
VELTPDGRTALRPAGNGTRWLASAVWGEVLLAQRDGSWERLKTCRNPVCPCVFHDASRNNSRVWHDVHSCGNIANLRASRARRRAESATS